MNPLRLAIQNALAVTTNRKGFLLAFQTEIEKLEFHPDAEPIILPVSRQHGLAWVRGELDDFDLIVRSGPCELIFGYTLPNKRAFRAAYAEGKRLYQKGATGFITYTRHPVMLSHWQRLGCGIQFRHPEGGQRLFGNENMVNRLFRDNLAQPLFPDSVKFPLQTGSANTMRYLQAQSR